MKGGLTKVAYVLTLLVVAACTVQKASTSDRATAPASPAPDAGDDTWETAPDAGVETEATCMDRARAGNGEACNECCTEVHARAWATTWDALRACACRKPKPTCTAECGASYCAGTLRAEDATLECTTCVSDSWGNENYDCMEAFAVTCRPDRECMAFFTCLDDCDHPPDAGAPDASK